MMQEVHQGMIERTSTESFSGIDILHSYAEKLQKSMDNISTQVSRMGELSESAAQTSNRNSIIAEEVSELVNSFKTE